MFTVSVQPRLFAPLLRGSLFPIRPSLPAFLLLVVLCLVLPPRLLAHDIPADAIVHLFVKPEGSQLRLLVRIPMASVQEVEWPVRKEDGAMDLALIDPFLRQAANKWIAERIEVYEGDSGVGAGVVAAARLSVEGDSAFGTFPDALAHVTGPPLPAETKLLPTQGMLDALLEYPIESERSRFSFQPRFEQFGVRVLTVLRFVRPDGGIRAFEYEGGNPGLVRLDPEWYQAGWTFVRMGFRHILDGTDHLLFLFCLVIPIRSFRKLVAVVTAFTVAHSFTLIASAYGLAPSALWFPPLIETLIAASIVYMALENIARENPSRRWLIAFGFGLVHGFGFSFALQRTLQFAGSHLLLSLLSFNVGVELGQIFTLALMVGLLAVAFRLPIPERTGAIILSAIAAHTGWHWMGERYEQLAKFPFTWPEFNAASIAVMLRWLLAVVLLAGFVWLVGVLRQSRRGTTLDGRL